MSPTARPLTPSLLEDLPPELHGFRRDRVTPVALVVSAVLHGLAILMYPLLVGPPPPGAVAPLDRDRESPQGIEIIQVVEVASDVPAVASPDELEETPEPAEPVVDLSIGDVSAVEIEILGPLDLPRRGTAERLRPRVGDPRLWTPLPDELVAVSRERLAELRMIWAIEDLNDSATAMAAVAMAGRDWTYTDENGGKWGVSPGKLHLGGITIPLPFSFSAPYNSARAQRARDNAEIAAAAGAAAIQKSLDERAREIRERHDREREARAKPDTTRIGGRQH